MVNHSNIFMFNAKFCFIDRNTVIPWYPWRIGSKISIDTKICKGSSILYKTTYCLHVTDTHLPVCIL